MLFYYLSVQSVIEYNKCKTVKQNTCHIHFTIQLLTLYRLEVCDLHHTVTCIKKNMFDF